MAEPKFAPREIFESILEWSVLPTFDIVFVYGEQGIVLLKRTIEPYKNVWALPGLRMYKGESIDDTLLRVAKQELGVIIDPSQKTLLAQYVGKFKTEFQRQDISTAYVIRLKGNEELKPNKDHFSGMKITCDVPPKTGGMYKYYIQEYLALKR